MIGLGLPPRTRGSPGQTTRTPSAHRSTPAYAGITAALPPHTSVAEVYPRVRGDHLDGVTVGIRDRGLPPRTRGSHGAINLLGVVPRSTPAYAGITSRFHSPSRRLRVYPRVRGDHAARIGSALGAIGLPPRTRGSPMHYLYDVIGSGSTPAYAGITDLALDKYEWPRVYPRVRGDHREVETRGKPVTGLPPRTRGSQLPSPRRRGRGWSTPAYAGITVDPASQETTARVYPRVRGDHRGRGPKLRHDDGLPPRTRGSPEGRFIHVI